MRIANVTVSPLLIRRLLDDLKMFRIVIGNMDQLIGWYLRLANQTAEETIMVWLFKNEKRQIGPMALMLGPRKMLLNF